MLKEDTANKLGQIGQIALTIRDLTRATNFYRDKLGLPFLFQTETMSFFDCDGLRLMLTLPEETGPDEVEGKLSNSIIYFNVSDLPQSYESLRTGGVEFEDAPHLIARLEKVEVWMAFFRDSESNLLGLMSEIAIKQG